MKMMRHLVAVAFFSFMIFFSAKSEEISNGSLFSGYQKGKVYFKNNTIVEAQLNYEIITKEMLFIQNERVLALGLTHTIDSIVIAERTFVNFEKCEFFEKINFLKGSLYIQYNATLLTKGKEAGYGGYSQTSKVTSLSSFGTSRDGSGLGTKEMGNHLTANEQIDVKQSTVFWIKQDAKFVEISSQRQVIKAFPKYNNEIKSYFIDHKVNFNSLSSVNELLIYCYSLF